MRLHFEEGERQLLAARLGLEEGADDAAVAQAVATWMQEDPNANGGGNNEDEEEANANADIPEGEDIVVVDVTEFRRLRQRDRVAAQIEAAETIRDRNELIEEAIADGKFGPARRNHYRTRYDSDPEGTRTLIARLTPNTVPLEARGATVPDEDVDSDSYPKDWVPEVAARQSREATTSRVHGES